MAGGINSQVTDAVTQASVHVLGLGAALAAVNSYLGLAQAQTLLYANMVNQQQHQAMLALAATVRCVKKLSRAAPAASSEQATASYYGSRKVSKKTYDAGRPVVT